MTVNRATGEPHGRPLWGAVSLYIKQKCQDAYMHLALLLKRLVAPQKASSRHHLLGYLCRSIRPR